MTPAQLKQIRAALGWSQARLANEMGVQRNTVNRWEMGLNPIPHMAQKLLDMLGKNASNQRPTAARPGRKKTR